MRFRLITSKDVHPLAGTTSRLLVYRYAMKMRDPPQTALDELNLFEERQQRRLAFALSDKQVTYSNKRQTKMYQTTTLS